MYIIRTDELCTREEVEQRMLNLPPEHAAAGTRVAQASEAHLYPEEARRGVAQDLVEVAHAFMSMGFEVSSKRR